mmetsp:Transcript_6964/g.15905  ORF Transcript_6964/g.15905 Transcript_6964/m.15905 type:complete len:212 (-) Transcript_6964:28-663(-)
MPDLVRQQILPSQQQLRHPGRPPHLLGGERATGDDPSREAALSRRVSASGISGAVSQMTMSHHRCDVKSHHNIVVVQRSQRKDEGGGCAQLPVHPQPDVPWIVVVFGSVIVSVNKPVPDGLHEQGGRCVAPPLEGSLQRRLRLIEGHPRDAIPLALIHRPASLLVHLPMPLLLSSSQVVGVGAPRAPHQLDPITLLHERGVAHADGRRRAF